MPQRWVELDNELSWLFTNRLSATKYMKVKRMEITEIWRRIWLFSANKIKISESFSKQPTQHIIADSVLKVRFWYFLTEHVKVSESRNKKIFFKNWFLAKIYSLLIHVLTTFRDFIWQWNTYIFRNWTLVHFFESQVSTF